MWIRGGWRGLLGLACQAQLADWAQLAGPVLNSGGQAACAVSTPDGLFKCQSSKGTFLLPCFDSGVGRRGV